MNEKPSVNAPSNFLVMYRNIMIANLLVLLRNLVLTSLPTLSPSVQQRPQLVMVARCVRYKPSDPPPNAPYDIFFVPQRIPRISQRRENKNQDLFSSRNSLLLPPSLLMCVVCIKGKNPHSWGNSDQPSANITLLPVTLGKCCHCCTSPIASVLKDMQRTYSFHIGGFRCLHSFTALREALSIVLSRWLKESSLTLPLFIRNNQSKTQ